MFMRSILGMLKLRDTFLIIRHFAQVNNSPISMVGDNWTVIDGLFTCVKESLDA